MVARKDVTLVQTLGNSLELNEAVVEISVTGRVELPRSSTVADTIYITLHLVNTVSVDIVVRSYLWVSSNRVSMTTMTMTAVSRASMAEGKVVS